MFGKLQKVVERGTQSLDVLLELAPGFLLGTPPARSARADLRAVACGSSLLSSRRRVVFRPCVMTSSYAHVMDRQVTITNRLESPITSNNLDNLQAKKNFSVSHLLDLEEAGEMVGTQADESVGEAGRSMLESPGLTSGSDTTQQESKLTKPEATLNGKHGDIPRSCAKSAADDEAEPFVCA